MSMQSVEANIQATEKSRFRVLSDGQCAKIYNAALEILERTGVVINNNEALSLLKDAGCFVDNNRVRIPSFVVKRALNTVPSRVTLCDRTGKRKLFLEGHNTYFGPGPTCPNCIDLDSGEKRPAIKQDVINTAVLCDALPNIDFAMGLSLIADHESTLTDVHELHALLQNTTKPIIGWAYNLANLKDMIDMCIATAGSLEQLQRNPFIAIYSMPTTPLTHPQESLDKLLFMAKMKLPHIYTPGALIGGTSPVTIAGTLALGVADCLTGVVVSQLKQEGAPFIGASLAGTIDFKTAQGTYAAVESNLQGSASTDVFRWLGLPTWTCAGCTDSKVVDAQAAIDATLQIFQCALSGTNLVHDLALIDSGLTMSLESLVMCDEIIGQVRRTMAGIIINDETLALDVIDEVGPGGNFITTEHTFKLFKDVLYRSDLLEKRLYEQWDKDGRKTLEQRCNEKAKKILMEHKPAPLAEKTVKQLDEIVGRAENRVKTEGNSKSEVI